MLQVTQKSLIKKLAKNLRRITGEDSFEGISDNQIASALLIYQEYMHINWGYSVLDVARDIHDNTQISLKESAELVQTFRHHTSLREFALN
jgi:hypothetical protein